MQATFDSVFDEEVYDEYLQRGTSLFTSYTEF